MFNVPTPMYMSQQQQRPYQAMQGGGPAAAPVINPMQAQQPQQQNPMMGMAQMGMMQKMMGQNPMAQTPGANPMQPQAEPNGPYAPQTDMGKMMAGAAPQMWQGLQQDMHTPPGQQGFWPNWLKGMFI